MERVFRAIAIACTGAFFGAALYISLVQHPAALETGGEFAARFFPLMYARAAALQASLAVVGAAAAFAAWYLGSGRLALVAGVSMLSVVAFTLGVIAPVNQELMSGQLDASSPRAVELLGTWALLHAVRTALSGLAFAACLSSRVLPARTA